MCVRSRSCLPWWKQNLIKTEIIHHVVDYDCSHWSELVSLDRIRCSAYNYAQSALALAVFISWDDLKRCCADHSMIWYKVGKRLLLMLTARLVIKSQATWRTQIRIKSVAWIPHEMLWKLLIFMIPWSKLLNFEQYPYIFHFLAVLLPYRALFFCFITRSVAVYDLVNEVDYQLQAPVCHLLATLVGTVEVWHQGVLHSPERCPNTRPAIKRFLRIVTFQWRWFVFPGNSIQN